MSVCLLAPPRCGFSLSLFCNYIQLATGEWTLNHYERHKASLYEGKKIPVGLWVGCVCRGEGG